MTDSQRRTVLVATLGFLQLRNQAGPEVAPLRTWLDSWASIGRIAVGMAHQGFDVQLTRYDERDWRATFYTTGMEHSPTSATGTDWERSPWHATQRAAWEVLRNASADGQIARLEKKSQRWRVERLARSLRNAVQD